MSAIAVVVFDIDDTLYLERDYVRSGFQAVDGWCREHLGRPGFGASAWEAFQQGARATSSTASCAWGLPVEPSTRRPTVDVYRGHDPQIALPPDAAECLVRLAVASSWPPFPTARWPASKPRSDGLAFFGGWMKSC